MRTLVTVTALLILYSPVLAVTAALFASPASAREGWQGRPLVCNPLEIPDPTELKKCQTWISKVKKPDNRAQTCCGESDAYIADRFIERDGKYYAVITTDYPPMDVDDGEGSTVNTPGVPQGKEVLIPPEKLNRAYEDGGNPSGHGIVFMSSDGSVLCYFGPVLG